MCFAIGCPGHFPCWIQETTALRDKIVRRRQELATLDAEHLRLNHQSDHLFMHGTQARYQREHGRLRSASRGLWAERSMRPGRDQGKKTGWCVGITDSMSGWQQTGVGRCSARKLVPP